MRTYVAGDLGGTNCRLILGQLDDNGASTHLFEKTYKSHEHPHLIVILQSFILEAPCKVRPNVAGIAVAGPVTANRYSLITNLNWSLDAEQMSSQLNIEKVFLINDFAAIGYGLLRLTPGDLVKINDVPAQLGAPIACLGAGTGLGEVYLTHNGREYDVWSSEGGHADFASRTLLEFELLDFIRKRAGIDRVSVERVVSGSGLPVIYEFLKTKHNELVSSAVENELAQGGDPGEIITRHATDGSDVICKLAFDLWLSAYGAEAGNLALRSLCYGGLYIAGGIAPKVIKSFTSSDDTFWRSMCAKGRMKEVIQRIPTYVVTHRNVGMLGAEHVCHRLCRGLAEKGDGLLKG
ncbi:Glucokinase [Plasmodiophora brassicae]|uniref:Glucokinase n=1 Tax=Plasmodiophora brassicae TaxID=37360 RepID=A0A3P3Y884_PLABS|nr:unnamed protein product [Plasmodiophora brassicae]